MLKLKIRIYQFVCLVKFICFKLLNPVLKNKYSNIWLISERGAEARDNAYIFYKYLKKEHPEIKIKYVISSNSPDIEKIDNCDRVLLGSFEHYLTYINASILISTHIMGFSPEMRIFSRFRKIKFFQPTGKIVFLQHGITSNYIESLLVENIGKLDLFISGSKVEYDYLKNTYGYNDKILKYTGFARYDNLINQEENIILLMPTWRKELFYVENNEKFKLTDYYNVFNNLINNKTLNAFLKKNNMYLYFYPHYEIQRFVSSFETSSKNVIIADINKYDVQDLLKKSKILITDYSSVFYDFAYMKKGIIYYQFDYDNFFSNHYKEGNFNFNLNGFGPVCYDESSVVKNVIDIYSNGIDKLYLDRVNNYFLLNDTKNCQRIYDEIIKL